MALTAMPSLYAPRTARAHPVLGLDDKPDAAGLGSFSAPLVHKHELGAVRYRHDVDGRREAPRVVALGRPERRPLANPAQDLVLRGARAGLLNSSGPSRF